MKHCATHYLLLVGVLMTHSLSWTQNQAESTPNYADTSRCPPLEMEFRVAQGNMLDFQIIPWHSVLGPIDPIDLKLIQIPPNKCGVSVELLRGALNHYPKLAFRPPKDEIYSFKLEGNYPSPLTEEATFSVFMAKLFTHWMGQANYNPLPGDESLVRDYISSLRRLQDASTCDFDILVGDKVTRIGRVSKSLNQPAELFPCLSAYDVTGLSFKRLYLLKLIGPISIDTSVTLTITECGCVGNTARIVLEDRIPEADCPPCENWFNICISGATSYRMDFTADFDADLTFFTYTDPVDASTFRQIAYTSFSTSDTTGSVTLDSLATIQQLKMLISRDQGMGTFFRAEISRNN